MTGVTPTKPVKPSGVTLRYQDRDGKPVLVERCQTCGQTIKNVRYGVKLSATKARIFDLIKARPGITRNELAIIVLGGVTAARVQTIAAHINQLRNAFAGTGIRVEGRTWRGITIRGLKE